MLRSRVALFLISLSAKTTCTCMHALLLSITLGSGKFLIFRYFLFLGKLACPKGQNWQIGAPEGPLDFQFVFICICIHTWVDLWDDGLPFEWRAASLAAVVAPGCYKGCAPACAFSSSALSPPELRPARSVGRVQLPSISMLKFVSSFKTLWWLWHGKYLNEELSP